MPPPALFCFPDEYAKRLSGFLSGRMNGISPEDGHRFFETMNRMLSENRSDIEIFSTLGQIYKEISPQIKEAPSTARASERVKDIEEWLKALKGIPLPSLTYLDVGASEGNITDAVVDYFGLSRENAFAIDLMPLETPPSRFQFFQNTPDKIPLEDNKFYLATAFQALHHFSNLDTMLKEIQRVLKDGKTSKRGGGFFIIREHDVPPGDEELRSFLDTVHAFYALVIRGWDPQKYLDEYDVTYHSAEEWERILVASGFMKVTPSKKIPNDRFASYYQLFRIPPPTT